MVPMSFGKLAGKPGFRKIAVATTSLAAIALAEPAWAQCSTSTAGGITTLTCGNTVTAEATNTDGNTPSTSAQLQRFANRIDAAIPSGATITGFGLSIEGTGSNPVTVTNNGTVSNTGGAADLTHPIHGLEIQGNGGLVTYLGNGSVTTNRTAPGAGNFTFGLYIGNRSGGGINVGSQAAPVTGTFTGSGGLTLLANDGDINAYFAGGTFTSGQTLDSGAALNLSAGGNINLVMTGHAVVNGESFVAVELFPRATSSISITTDAQMTTGIGAAMQVSGTSGGTSVNLTNGALLTGRTEGLLMFAEGGEMRLTMAAGATVRATDSAGSGVRLQPLDGTGTIVADLSGTIASAGTGLSLTPANGNVGVTIREGGSVSGDAFGISVARLAGHTGAVDILNLGTISSPATAADFDGTLRIGNGGTSGTITGNIVNRGGLIFNRSDAVTYGGIISGTGTLTKQGAGTLTLTGASTYTGATNVSAGTLSVTGSLASAVTVANGATLGGTGSVGSTNVNGTLSPGGDGAIGTLTINGNLVFGAGSTFRADIGNGTSDRVIVTGTATLAGSVAAFATGSVFTQGTHTLLTANGGRTGTFNSLTASPDAPVQLTYDANNVYLRFDGGPQTTMSISTRDSLVFAAPTVTTNRTSAFSTQIIGRLLGGQPLYDQTFAAAFASTAVQNAVTAARAAITTAGGPGVIIGDPVRTASTTTSTTTTGIPTYSLAGPGVETVDSVITFGPAPIQIGALSTCDVSLLPSTTRPACTTGGTSYAVGSDETNINTTSTTTYTVNETRTDSVTETLRETWELNGTVVAVGTIHAEVQSGLFDLGGRLLGRLGAVEAGSAGWGELYRFRVSQSGRRDAWGLAAGFGLAVAPGVTLVAGIDHGNLDIDLPGALETGKVELTEIGAALRYDSGPFSASVAAVHGFGNAETRRTIVGTSDADYDVRLTGVAMDLGYAIDLDGWTLRPGAGLDYISLSTDGFTETDMLGLVVRQEDADRLRASAGLAIERDFGGFALSASARYLAILSGSKRRLPVAFTLAPGRVLEMSGPGEPDGVLLGARLAVPLSPGAALFFGYDGRFGGDYEAHGGTAGLRVIF